MSPTVPTLKARALRCLALRDHSRLELTRKLACYEADAEKLEALLDELEAAGLIQADRMIEAAIHRLAPKFGNQKIVSVLGEKGFDLVQVAQCLKDQAQSELERARIVWEKRFGGQEAADWKEKAKQVRFLVARGFAVETAKKVID